MRYEKLKIHCDRYLNRLQNATLKCLMGYSLSIGFCPLIPHHDPLPFNGIQKNLVAATIVSYLDNNNNNNNENTNIEYWWKALLTINSCNMA